MGTKKEAADKSESLELPLKKLKQLLEAKAEPPDPMSQLHRLASGEGLSIEEEKGVLEWIRDSKPGLFVPLCNALLKDRREKSKVVAKAEVKQAKAESQMERLARPPLHPATVLCDQGAGCLQVVCDSRRLIVTSLPELDAASIAPGDEVYLDSESGVAVARGEARNHAGLVGTVSELAQTGVVLQGVAGEELVAIASAELLADLEAGDRVLYNRDFPYILERLPKCDQSRFLLEAVPDVSFDDIGGLGELVDEVRSMVDLHLRHPALVDKYDLQVLRGLTLVGPPGVGKTLFAKAIANHLAKGAAQATGREDLDGAKASFIHVKPGMLRGSYYGQTEARMRELFACARSAPGLVVIFFDELDSYGSRGEGIGQDIDGRTLGTLLSEMDGLEAIEDIICIGATNRLDLCDAALVRQGRMGDRIYSVPRPGRAATREIFERYLDPTLDYVGVEPDALVLTATAYLHAPRDGAGVIATATLRNGDTHEVRAREILSGAMLATAVQNAKHAAARREVEAHGDSTDIADEAFGIGSEDLLAALDEAIVAEAQKISVPHVARRVLDIPNADEIVRVDVAPDRTSPRHRYLRVA
ncbi:MAG: AAA family ATPase [bacterium]|nr:AAA family ATPase [bacterium]